MSPFSFQIPKFSRQDTPATTAYYDADGKSTAQNSPEMNGPAKPDGVEAARTDASTAVQSPVPPGGFPTRSHGSMIQDAPADGPSMPQSEHEQQRTKTTGEQPGQGQQSEFQLANKQKEPDSADLPPVPVYYDETKGAFETRNGPNNDEQRYGSQKSPNGKGSRFATNGSANKLTKGSSPRSRNANEIERRQSSTSHRSTANIGDANGAFAMGAAMTSPEVQMHDELDAGLQERANAAEESLTKKQSLRVKRHELTFSKRISRIIKNEAKTEGQSLEASIKELASMQKLQTAAVKEESMAHTNHTKALQNLHARELAVIKAQSELEKVDADVQARLAKIQSELQKPKAKAQAQLDSAQAEVERARAEVKAHEVSRDASRKHAMTTTDWVKDKRKEVEVLRGWMGVDDREREARLNELKA